MTQKNDEGYAITFKGLISGVVNPLQTERIVNEIQNYMVRHKFNAIVYDPASDHYLYFVKAKRSKK